jgi:SAM-dependent methyltransferase
MFSLRRSLSLTEARENMLATGKLDSFKLACLNRINLRIHSREKNYLSDGGEHYLKVGLSALDCIESALKSVDHPQPGSILDFPCGYGRVLRFLKAAYPIASFIAAELDSKALKFCRKNFGVQTVLSETQLHLVKLPQPVELIWCGSLVTHFNEDQINQLLRLFYQQLLPGGLCVFTSHGLRVETLLESGEINYSLNQDQVQEILSTAQTELDSQNTSLPGPGMEFR